MQAELLALDVGDSHSRAGRTVTIFAVDVSKFHGLQAGEATRTKADPKGTCDRTTLHLHPGGRHALEPQRFLDSIHERDIFNFGV